MHRPLGSGGSCGTLEVIPPPTPGDSPGRLPATRASLVTPDRHPPARGRGDREPDHRPRRPTTAESRNGKYQTPTPKLQSETGSFSASPGSWLLGFGFSTP